MRQATQLPVRNQLSPRGPCPLQPQLAPSLQDGAAGKPAPRPQQAPPGSEEPPPRQPAVPCHVPRLRAVVESQAFRNILVDEVDMMHARAATLIQANWRGHRLRQKLVSQMTAAKAIQEAWRRFSTRRLRRSSKVTVRRRSEEGDIPYHPPQQVRFGPQPLTASKETPVSASVILEPCAPRPLSLPPPAVQGPPAPGVRAPSAPMAAILLHQAVASSLPCSRSLDPKCQPSLVATNAVRSPCLVSSPVAEDTAQSRCVSSRATKAGAPESPLSGRCCQAASAAPGTQAQVEAEPLRTPAQTYGMASTTRASSRTYAGAAITKPAAQTCPAPTLTRTQPQTCPAPTLTRTQPQTCPAPTLTRTQPQTCPAPTLTRTQPQTCLAPTLTKAPAQAQPTPQASTPPPSQPTALKSRTPTQQGWMPVSTKASALMGLVPALGRGPLQTPPVATVCKTLSQTSPVTSTPKPPSQMSLAAMISRTPAQIRSVTAVLKTLCPTLPAASNLKAAPPAARPAGAPGSSSSLPLAASRTKVPASRREAAAGTAKGSDLSCWAGRRLKGAPQPHLETGAPGAPTRGPLEAKSTHTGAQKPVHKDTACKTDVAMRATKVPSWAGVSKDRSQPLSQTLQRTEVIKVQSQVYMPVQVAVSVPQAQVAVPLTKALAPGRPAKASSQPQAVTRLTAPTRVHPTAKQIKALSQLRLATCPAKAEAQAHPPSRLSKAPSLAHLVTCLSRTQSQVQLGTEAARRVYTAQQSGDFGSKAQSHPLLTGPKASTPSCRLPGTLDSGFRIKPEHRPGKATQGARPTVPEPQGTLVPLLTSAAATHPGCSVEPWGDSKTTRAQLPTPGQAAPSQEDMLASQITALCTELVTALGSQEDLRVLLARTLSQGEVWAALNQVLSKEALGATVAKALPQGMLGLALAKALSWGELGATLSRALSRGELRAELAKAMHSRVTEVLSRALTQEERVALSRALCQGELGAVLSQSLSRAAPRTGAILPKAASKVTSSKMPLPPARVEVRAWDPCLRSPVRLQPSKGPVDTSTRGGQPWTSTLPSVAVRPLDCAVAPHTPLQPARSPGPWDRVGCTAAATPRPPGDLSLSVQYMEKIVVHAATVIQACARGYLVRRAIRAWHQRATAIQATWRGHRVRRNLAQLYKAATVIQAAWRGHCVRRARAQHMQLPPAWTTPSEARAVAEHRCFQSCQPRACSLCTSLSPRLGSPPSVVMLVGASPRTCHTCGHTLPTRVVHGTGRAGALQAHASRPALQQLWHSQQQWDAAATTIQSAWRGFKARRQLREQQLAARMVQATWRGHYTRSCLTPEALLGTGSPWDSAPGAPSHDPRQLARRSGV
ncbi:PREDICTED: uncharacterized protein KIAA1683 homolog isoform X3 [Chinchilla lanigera]|uniref:uncharacterized protein KIAA1683 homolog isoform X2 n=1 Tax=Chinchilla lanigera TaxID=34839 RepID=UPI000696D7F0|nr:PREDICTED: uncharacterized protein KIAA1683 homolog isoform X2 [Chinchilla lanigera]XP_013362770.1 PREDICTED: uncharacterized protein KIAA1683 homolog isoform X3 [Chinchilla lanigera]